MFFNIFFSKNILYNQLLHSMFEVIVLERYNYLFLVVAFIRIFFTPIYSSPVVYSSIRLSSSAFTVGCHIIF